VDDAATQNTLKFFDAGADNARPKLWKELGLASVGEL
jgi:hypothetical protein